MLLEDNLSSFKDKLAIGKHLTIDLHKISIRFFQEVYWCFSFSFFFLGGGLHVQEHNYFRYNFIIKNSDLRCSISHNNKDISDSLPFTDFKQSSSH